MIDFIFLAAGLFALGCDDYIFAGLLPDIGASFQSTIVAVAQGIAVHGLAYVSAFPICLFLLKNKTPRQVLLLALVTFIAGNTLTMISSGLTIFLIGRATAGFGAGLYLPLAVATCGELVRTAAKGRALGMAWGANAAGAVIGIPVGLWLNEKTNWRVSVGLILFLSLVVFLGLLLRTLNLKSLGLPSLHEQISLLVDRAVMSVIGITLLTATSGFCLYVYTSAILTDSVTSPASALSIWNVGGLIGSLSVGYVMDRMSRPQWLVVMILLVLLTMFLLVPVVRFIPFLGLLPFLIWGAMGWSTMTPQHYQLIQLKPGHDVALVALNSTAVSLGGVAGAALGGLAIQSGLEPRNLPFAAAGLVLGALIWQLLLIRRPFPKISFLW